jgi:hypothetical protein
MYRRDLFKEISGVLDISFSSMKRCAVVHFATSVAAQMVKKCFQFISLVYVCYTNVSEVYQSISCHFGPMNYFLCLWLLH